MCIQQEILEKRIRDFLSKGIFWKTRKYIQYCVLDHMDNPSLSFGDACQ